MFPSSGYGSKSIDLGAPGTDILSLFPDDSVATLTGTSMSAPHVTGALGFLHSVAHHEFQSLHRSHPSQAARILKALLLNSVKPLDDLKGVTLTGGRLSLSSSVRQMLDWTQEKLELAKVLGLYL